MEADGIITGVFFLIFIFFLFFLVWIAINHTNKAKKASDTKFQSDIENFLDGLTYSVDSAVDDTELLDLLQPLKDIGRDYPPANDVHSRIYNRLRIARTVIDNFD